MRARIGQLALFALLGAPVSHAQVFHEVALGGVPCGVAAGADGSIWVAVGPTGIARISPIDGSHVVYPLLQQQASTVNLCAGPDGNIWFVENVGDVVGKVTPSGVMTEYSVTSFSAPTHICAGGDGNLWFVEYQGSKVGRVTTSGVVTEFPMPSLGGRPSAIALGPDQALWYTLGGANRIGRFTEASGFVEYTVPTPDSGPGGITAGPDGALWFTEQLTGKIGRIAVDGTITEFNLPNAQASPEWIVTGPDGALWFTEMGANRIASMTTSGIVREFDIPTSQAGLLGISWGPDNAVWAAEVNTGKAVRLAPPHPVKLFTTTPCRLIDTRGPDGPRGGPRLETGVNRDIALEGACGLPADAVSIVANVTVTNASVGGSLVVVPSGTAISPGLTPSVVSFPPGRTRANNAVISINGIPGQSLTLRVEAGGPVDAIVDVAGFFR